MAFVEAKNVKYAYSLTDGNLSFAVNGVDIEINRGEFVAILGHNGSGKSTFARMVNGLMLPSEGDMIIDGMNTRDEDLLFEIRKRAGMVFQNPDNQLVATVVEEDVAFGPENVGIPHPELGERVDAALNAVGMEKYRRRAPHMLSGGQKQRVAIAGALALKPELIVFDEATAMLDPKGRRQVLSIIDKLNSEGMAVVLITHYMEEAALADRVIVMRGGYVEGMGTPREVLADRELLSRSNLAQTFAGEVAYEIGIKDSLTIEELAQNIAEAKLIPNDIELEDEPHVPTEEGVAITTKALTYTYLPGTPFEKTAVSNVDMDILPGEFVGIVGETGSGKSTLINMLAGLLPPTSGDITVGEVAFGKNMDKKALRRMVGVVFQYPEDQLFEETVEKDIGYGPKMAGLSEEEVTARVKRAMELVGLDYETHKAKSPFELSGGQKRMAAVAGVLAMEPKVLIMDEPIAGMDPASRERFMELIAKLHGEGRTIVMISHSMDGIAEYAERIIALRNGEKILDAPVRAAFAERELLKEAGLSLPQTAEAVDALIEQGVAVSRRVIRKAELIRTFKGGAAW